MHINGLPEYMNNHSTYKALGLAGAISTRSDIIRALPMPDINYYCIKGYVDTDVDREMVEPYLEYYVNLAQDLTGIKDDTLYQATRYEGRGTMCAYYEDTIAINDITGSCKFMGWWFDMPLSPDIMARLYSAGIGKETSADDLYQAARRVVNLERAFNIREGRTREMDTLPKRAFKHAVPDGKFKGEVMDPDKFEEMKDEFYTTRGWNLKTGFPTRQTLLDLDLPEAVADLEKRSLLSA
jgi:aldehyde:ferredoxin oxidoreductase